MGSRHEDEPLVTVGVPTYNRAKTVRNAIESVLNQDYANIELVISDDASTDGTQAVCEGFARQDERIKYIRQDQNLGMSANFQAVLKEAEGEFFMWLSDDDWLDRAYLNHCVEFLRAHPDYVLASGRMRHDGEDGSHHHTGPLLDFAQERGSDRVVSYFGQAGPNDDVLYGVIRRQVLLRTHEIRNTLGGDWLMVASVLFMGKTHTVADAIGYRRAGGASKTYKNLVRVFGIPKYIARIPYIHLAPIAFRDIVYESPAYAALRRTSRIWLAVRVCAILLRLEARGHWRRLHEFATEALARILQRARA